MLPITNYETYHDGQIIFEEGSHGDWLYEIDSGSVELSKKFKGINVVIEILQSGDIFGELAFIARVPRTATARAIGETTIGIIDRNFLDEEYNKLSQYFQSILKTLALRLEKTTKALMDIKIDKTAL
ncbi:MAG: cyclic nucleotide-binding domain-containing protein [Deltaproteobacteria bacterium]|nr:cyclic nucleotide-binding domain-containing protein [Deltaproteobacteria bacterium]